MYSDPVASRPPDEPPVVPPEMRRLRIFFILAFGSSISTLSMDYFAPSMPNVTRDLDVPIEAVKAAMTLFLLGYGFGPFVWGSLADRIGRRRVMLTGLTCYVLASLGCLLAPTIQLFTLFRLGQGFSAASTAIVARAVLRDVWGAAGATRAIARMFLIMVWIPVTAPVVGGLTSSLFDWRVNFAVMVAVAATIGVAAWIWLAETNPAHTRSALAGVRRWKEIITHRVFLRYTLTNMLLFASLLLFLSNYSYVTERQYGLTPGQNGLVLTAFNGSVAAGFYLVWLTVPRIGVEGSMRLGRWLALTCWAGILLLALQPEPALALMLPCVALACLGTGLVVSLAAGEALVPFPHAAGTASATFILLQSFGASVINYITSVMFDVTLVHLAALLGGCALLATVTARIPAPHPETSG